MLSTGSHCILGRLDLRANGNAHMIEMRYDTNLLDYRIQEVPIFFDDRLYAKSRLSRFEALSGMQTII